MAANRKILVIGKSGRVDCLTSAINASPRAKEIFILSEVSNSSLSGKCAKLFQGRTEDRELVKAVAQEVNPDLAIIGPEEPLAAGVVDLLEGLGVRCVGPKKELARIESSKAFARQLIDKYLPDLNPRYRIFDSIYGIQDFMEELGEFVVKPDGLTGGKGVRVLGEHMSTIDEAIEYSREIIVDDGQKVLIEEKLDGEEFSLQSLTDGHTVVSAPPVQDHKRAYDDDKGPNTGGMGSYSCADHLLPFLDQKIVESATHANAAVVRALKQECGEPYRGILYGGFMLTGKGLKLVEYNARFGDPEVMNVLPLLENDFLDVCDAIADRTLDELEVKFQAKATVCKYVVPQEYPAGPAKEAPIEIAEIPYGEDMLKVYFGAINTDEAGHHSLIGSRALAFVGIADSLETAEKIAEAGTRCVTGPVRHRSDIGTPQLISKRVRHMEEIKSGKIASAA